MRIPALTLGCALLAGASFAWAQARPSRGAFLRVVAPEAASRVTGEPCHEGEPQPVRHLPRTSRAQALGRVLALPASGAAPRFGAFVTVATARGDANADPARRLFFIVIELRGQEVVPAARLELPLGDAPYFYEVEPPLRVARVTDVDDDGEEELFVVLSSDMAVECGTGFCSRRRTVVIDLGAEPALMANVPTGLSCETEAVGTVRSSTTFADVDGDGHRDLLHVRRRCEVDFEANPEGEPRCGTRERWVRRWLPEDRYAAPVPVDAASELGRE